MKIQHIALTVYNLEESIRFYTELLGFTFEKQFEREDLGGKAAFVRLGDVQLELWEFQEATTPTEALDTLQVVGIRHIALAVEDLDKTIAKLAERGVKSAEAKVGASGVRYSFINDPSGISIELYEEK